MKKVITGLLSVGLLTSCVKKPVQIKAVDYSLLDRIYQNVEKKDLEKIEKIREEDKKVLKIPRYIKVYRGSFKDENGNVVEGGFELIRIDDGAPDTDF